MILNFLSILIPILFTLGQLGRISFYNQQVNIYAYELLIILELLILISKYKLEPIKKVFKRAPFLPIFFIWLLISFTLQIHEYPLLTNIVGFMYLARLMMYTCWGIYSFFDSHIHKESDKKISIVIIIFTLIISTISLSQFLLYPDLNNLRYLGWDMHYNRLFGLFFDTSITGAIFGMLIWIILFLRKKIKPIWLSYCLLLICFLCGVLTFSRNFYIAFIFSLLMFTLITKNWKILITLLITFIILIIVVPKQFGPGVGLLRFFTFQSRLQEYGRAFVLWEKSPIIGVGYNRLKYVKEIAGQLDKNLVYPSHSSASYSSSFAIILVTGGIIGLTLFLLSLIQISILSPFFAVVITFLSIMSIADNILLHPFILFLLCWSTGKINLFGK